MSLLHIQYHSFYYITGIFLTLYIFIIQTCKAVYDKIIDLKIATPQIIINYGLFLEENNYFEEAFRVC